MFTDTTDKLWVDHPTPTRTVVCLRFDSLATGGLTIVADVAGAMPPEVGDDAALCATAVAALTDPVALRPAVGLDTGSVCLTLGSRTLRISLEPGNVGPGTRPVLEVWHDGGANWGWVDAAACPVEYAGAVAFGGPTTCMSANDRIFP